MSQLLEMTPFATDRSVNASIYVVEYDDNLRCNFQRSLECFDEEVLAFASGREFRNRARTNAPGCAIFDASTGDGSIDLIEALHANGSPIVSVMILANDDIRLTVRAIQAGAVDVLNKSVAPEQLRKVVGDALPKSYNKAMQYRRRCIAASRLAGLSSPQKNLLRKLIDGQTNREAARELGFGIRTVERMRAMAMETLGIRTLVEYVQLLHVAGFDNVVELDSLSPEAA